METKPDSQEAAQSAVRELADHLRSQGVVVVAGRALAVSRPEGVDLVTSLPVLVGQIAGEWMAAAAELTHLDPDRLQIRSAATLLSQAALALSADGIPADAVHEDQLARAVALRSAISARAEDTELLDRTWVVLHDLRRMGRSHEPNETTAAASLVPSAATADRDLARALPAALNRAACAGALIGLLAPWLPAPALDGAARVDQLLQAVSDMARAPQDESWRESLATIGRVAASLSVAAAYSASGLLLEETQALSYTFSEPALRVLLEQATQVALEAAGEAEGIASEGKGATADAAPVPSPSQQARAAAERAAAERRATQQAFMDRAAALRAATRRGNQPAASATPIPLQHGGAEELEAPLTDDAGSVVDLEVAGTTGSSPMSPSSTRLLAAAEIGSTVPRLAKVQEELGEDDDVVELALWDVLMRPR